jgi:hypothetical protein
LTDLIGEPMILFRRDIPFGTMVAQACQQANVELESIVDVTRADQALALVKGRLGLEIVDEFAAHAQDLIIRPLIEELELVSTFVYSTFSPPSRNTVLLMHAVYRQAQRMNRHITRASPPA